MSGEGEVTEGEGASTEGVVSRETTALSVKPEGEKAGGEAQTDEEKAAAEKAAEEKAAAEGGEAQTDEEKAAAEKAAKDKEEKAEGAPEKYDEFKVPEDLKIDDAKLAEFHDVAKDLNLSQEQAQKLVDYEGKRVQEMIQDWQTAQQEAWTETLDGWLDGAKKDEEFGGAKFDDNIEVAKGAVSQFGTPELFKAMDDLGVGNHPEVIRFCYRIGKALGEAKITPGRGSGGDESFASKLYPSMKQS